MVVGAHDLVIGEEWSVVSFGKGIICHFGPGSWMVNIDITQKERDGEKFCVEVRQCVATQSNGC